ADQSVLPVEVSAKTFPDGRVIAFVRDVSARKVSEQALASSEKKYRTLVESAYDSILILDEKGMISFINEQLSRQFEYAEHELIGQPIEVLIPKKFWEKLTDVRKSFERELRCQRFGNQLDL